MITFVVVLLAVVLIAKVTRGWPRVALLVLLGLGFLVWLASLL